MTSKQKFMYAFLKYVYGFTDVKFEENFSGCMCVKGTYTFYTSVPARCFSVGSSTRTQTVCLDIRVDKLKNGGHTIKFKTWGTHIREAMFETVIGRAKRQVPGAKVDIYNRTHAYSQKADIPTLRLKVSELPWK